MTPSDTAVAGPSVIVRQAAHVDGKYRQDINDCDKSIAGHAGLDYIAHLTSGVWDFSVHPAAYTARQEAFDKAARQLGLIVARIDATADQLGSGPLIRVVVQGDRGALFQVLKVAGQNFFGMVRDGSAQAVERADRELVAIVDRAAARIGSPSLLWGAYKRRGDTNEIWPPGMPASLEQEPADSAAIVREHPLTSEMLDRCRRVLDRSNVHFVGIYHHDKLVWRADMLADPGLAPLFQRVSPGVRRRGYDKVIRQVTLQHGRIMQLLGLTGSDALTRLVLDVARGAIYLLPLDHRGYSLVGVTLVQSQVRSADRKLNELREELVAMAFRPGGQ
jgi:hypothetical protein